MYRCRLCAKLTQFPPASFGAVFCAVRRYHDDPATQTFKIDIVALGRNRRIRGSHLNGRFHFDQLETKGARDIVEVAGDELT